jgi:hypothetical protein
MQYPSAAPSTPLVGIAAGSGIEPVAPSPPAADAGRESGVKRKLPFDGDDDVKPPAPAPAPAAAAAAAAASAVNAGAATGEADDKENGGATKANALAPAGEEYWAVILHRVVAAGPVHLLSVVVCVRCRHTTIDRPLRRM